jgi:hypothetical protein
LRRWGNLTSLRVFAVYCVPGWGSAKTRSFGFWAEKLLTTLLRKRATDTRTSLIALSCCAEQPPRVISSWKTSLEPRKSSSGCPDHERTHARSTEDGTQLSPTNLNCHLRIAGCRGSAQALLASSFALGFAFTPSIFARPVPSDAWCARRGFAILCDVAGCRARGADLPDAPGRGVGRRSHASLNRLVASGRTGQWVL